jgi:hypothetical protein
VSGTEKNYERTSQNINCAPGQESKPEGYFSVIKQSVSHSTQLLAFLLTLQTFSAYFWIG